MDLQVSSNFERLQVDAVGGDAAEVRRMMASLAQSKAFTIPDGALAAIRRGFRASRAGEDAVQAEMRATWRDAGYLLDPHTAVGVVSGREVLAGDPATPLVVLGTAHPAKFPDAVRAATGQHPALPDHLADLHDRAERFTVLPSDRAGVERFIRDRARATRESAA